jgi:hypothetical protein
MIGLKEDGNLRDTNTILSIKPLITKGANFKKLGTKT